MRMVYKIVSIDREIRTRGGKTYQTGKASDGSNFDGKLTLYLWETEEGLVDVDDVVSADFDFHDPMTIRNLFVEQGRNSCAPAPPQKVAEVPVFDPNPFTPPEPHVEYAHLTNQDIQEQFRAISARLDLLESKFHAHLGTTHKDSFGFSYRK